jgi:hypothetical protein
MFEPIVKAAAAAAELFRSSLLVILFLDMIYSLSLKIDCNLFFKSFILLKRS